MRTFNAWMAKVDEALTKISGLNSDCIEDYDYYDAFDQGKTPTQTARAALANAGWDRTVRYYR